MRTTLGLLTLRGFTSASMPACEEIGGGIPWPYLTVGIMYKRGDVFVPFVHGKAIMDKPDF